LPTILVTGGAGFIGSNFTRFVLKERPGWRVVVLDALTYAGNLENLEGLEADFPGRYRFVKGDITDEKGVTALFREEGPELVAHLAAESHVDRSILGPLAFVTTNVRGSAVMLEAARQAWGRGEGRFLQVSTDEVYGSLKDSGYFTEQTPLDPSSPYSASKAAADHLVLAYGRTFGLPVVVTRCCNNYGPYQFPEKLIPLMISRALSGESLPVYGSGMNVRDWIHVEDHCRGLLLALEKGRPGEVYNLGSRCEMRNLDLVRTLLGIVAEVKGWDRAAVERRITFVTDRPGHDWRYAIDPAKAERELGFAPQVLFSRGLAETVEWYLSHEDWIRRVQTGEYRQYVTRLYGPQPGEPGR
jgi:dTDP-glucose 4,6-dehydratase